MRLCNMCVYSVYMYVGGCVGIHVCMYVYPVKLITLNLQNSDDIAQRGHKRGGTKLPRMLHTHVSMHVCKHACARMARIHSVHICVFVCM